MGDCLIEEDEFGNDVWNDRIQLSVTRGSGEWRNGALEMLERENASALVVATIETGRIRRTRPSDPGRGTAAARLTRRERRQRSSVGAG